MHKGDRFCFIAAIVRPNIASMLMSEMVPKLAYLMVETIDKFKGGERQTKDYHDVCNHAFFAAWMMKKKLNALGVRIIAGATTVMDNAAYHYKRPEGAPKGNREESMQTARQERGITVVCTDTESMLWSKLMSHIKQDKFTR